MNKLVELIKNVNNIRYELNHNVLTIYNIDNDNKIEVIKEMVSSHDEYIVSFKTQHCHFENDYEEIFEYINNIINDKSFPIEFFLNNKDLFGGEISKEEYDNISIDSLAKHFGCSEDYILDFSYEIHSWSGKYDVNRIPISILKDGNNDYL